MKAFRVVVVLLALAALAVGFVGSAGAAEPNEPRGTTPYPPQGVVVWSVWLNETVDIVNPQPRLECWDTPVFRHEGTDYFGWRTCSQMVQRARGRWYLLEWRGQIGVPLSVERARRARVAFTAQTLR